MSRSSVKLPAADSELARLVEAMCDGTIAPGERDRLESLLADDRDAKLYYVAYMDLHAHIQWLTRGQEESASEFGVRGSGQDFGFAADVPAAEAAGPPASGLRPLCSPLATSHYPLATPFVGGPVFSYMVATLIVGMMLLGAWAFKVTHDYRDVVNHKSQWRTAPGKSIPKPPELVFVGRITGMKDCRWADPKTQAYIGSSVPLDRRYALSAGLMEISYDSGAKVILEGPCTYQVETRASGYLALGKLTARVESKGLAASAASAKPQAANQARNPTSSLFFRPHSHGDRHRSGH